MKQRQCQASDCSNEFTPIKRTQKYCSQRCKNRAAGRRRMKRVKKALSYFGAEVRA